MKNNNRATESLAPMIHTIEQKDFHYPIKILTAPCDIGVRRNFGKNGARFAPTALINHLKKQNNHLALDEKEAIKVMSVSNQKDEIKNFEDAQKVQSKNILSVLKTKPQKLIHLGGGHDHIFPLLMAVDKESHYKNILIVNIDAHCDTRIDDHNHSGTPFRNYDTLGTKPYHLIQYGIQDFSNSKSTLSPLKRGSETKYFFETIKDETNNFSDIPKNLLKDIPFNISNKTLIILSLDCDGIDGSQMSAVSCVNPMGIPCTHVIQIQNYLSSLECAELFFGVYEFNPVYDQLNQYSCKVITNLIYNYLK